MKLKKQYVIQEVCGVNMAVSPDSTNLVKLTDTGAFIFTLLSQDTTEAAILDAMCERYDAEREVMQRDLAEFIGKLREAEMLDD